MKPLYISATLRDSGKTSVSLGLIQEMRARGHDPGYFKPVGQHYVSYAGVDVDEDAALMHQVFGLTDRPHCLSPIAIKRGFTTAFIRNPDVQPLEAEIANCFAELKKRHSSVVIEGTGHAGVGSCFGLSNARVAELLEAQVVIVTSGGIGRPIDEIAVSLALFQKHRVPVHGVILNKVMPEKYDAVCETVAKGLEYLGTRLLGSIPYDRFLTVFTMSQLVRELGCRVFCGEESLSNRIERTVIAAMEPQNVIQYVNRHTLVITPGDRVDNVLVSCLVLSQEYARTGGVILTGGLEPDARVAELLQRSGIPILVAEGDTFAVSSRMANLGFKIREFDRDKIERLHALVARHVDLDDVAVVAQN